MKKVTTLVLMLGFILSGALCYANGAARTENEKGKGQILTIHKAQHGGIDKSSSIVATLNGHVLSVVFTENLGQVAIEVSTTSGVSVDYISTPTPNGVQVYIPYAGNYIVTFTLPKGDEYYGEFTITD
jgi:hypothetical protein